MSLRVRFAGIASSLLLAVVTLAGPLAAPASAGYTTLCWGYSGCSQKGMTASGYAKVSSTMYWRMYAGHNCTNYAAYRMVKSGMPNTRPWNSSGNAENWGLAMSSITNQTPTVGAVAWWKQYVWPAGSAGHVAYVEKVVSPTEIIVSQDSWGGDFSWARITKDGKGWPSGFVHFNDVELDNTGLPTISGVAKVGGVLSAKPGTWSPSDVTLAYQWLADGSPIAGETASTLSLTAGQLDRVISVRVTASKAGFPKKAVVSKVTGPVLPGEIVNEAAPVVTGLPVVDATLSVVPGEWYPKPDELRYVWKADGERIEEATNSLRLPVGPDLLDKSITVTTIAKREGFERVRVIASAPGPVVPATFKVTEPAALSGMPRLGQVIALATGAVTPASTMTTEWLRDGQPVAGVEGTSYELTPEDLGTRLQARVTHSRVGYNTLPVTTATTRRVRTVSSMALSVTPGDRRGRAKVSATVTAPGLDVVEGVVRIRAAGELVAEVPLVNGRVAKTISGLEAGKRKVTVRFLTTWVVTAVKETRAVRVG